MKNFISREWFKICILILITVVILFYFLKIVTLQNKNVETIKSDIGTEQLRSEQAITETKEVLTNRLSDEHIKQEVSNILFALRRLHYISVNQLNKNEDLNPDTFVLTQISSSMNDINKLNSLLIESQRIAELDNDILSISSIAMNTVAKIIIKSNNDWIKYLRTVNMETVDLAEFQYQFALYNTSTHDAYLSLAEGMSMLPMISVEFSKDDSSQNKIKEEIKNVFLDNINVNFIDILAENDKFYAKTKNRYVVAVIIDGYINFFKKY